MVIPMLAVEMLNMAIMALEPPEARLVMELVVFPRAVIRGTETLVVPIMNEDGIERVMLLNPRGEVGDVSDDRSAHDKSNG
jgi:hypothetical protein